MAKLGDSVTTDHVGPVGAIVNMTPAAMYLKSHGIEPKDFNSYGSRRGNHEVMIRGTFANVRLRNQLAPDTEGGYTRDFTPNRSPYCHYLRCFTQLSCGGHTFSDFSGQGIWFWFILRLGC